MILAEKLGERTAELHQAFGKASENPDFAPEPVTEDWLFRWQGDLLNSVDSVFESLAGGVNGCSGADASLQIVFLLNGLILRRPLKHCFPGALTQSVRGFTATFTGPSDNYGRGRLYRRLRGRTDATAYSTLREVSTLARCRENAAIPRIRMCCR